MAYRYAFAPNAADDFKKLLRKHQEQLALKFVAVALPLILRDPPQAGEGKSGPLKGCFGHTLSRDQGGYRVVYTLTGDVVILLAIGLHDDAYRDATARIRRGGF